MQGPYLKLRKTEWSFDNLADLICKCLRYTRGKNIKLCVDINEHLHFDVLFIWLVWCFIKARKGRAEYLKKKKEIRNVKNRHDDNSI